MTGKANIIIFHASQQEGSYDTINVSRNGVEPMYRSSRSCKTSNGVSVPGRRSRSSDMACDRYTPLGRMPAHWHRLDGLLEIGDLQGHQGVAIEGWIGTGLARQKRRCTGPGTEKQVRTEHPLVNVKEDKKTKPAHCHFDHEAILTTKGSAEGLKVLRISS